MNCKLYAIFYLVDNKEIKNLQTMNYSILLYRISQSLLF
jgi:hypothetical protein